MAATTSTAAKTEVKATAAATPAKKAPNTYKLTYFNVRALAEPIRLMFAAAGVEYTDERVDSKAWEGLKASTPFGQLPVLEVNGKVLAQSAAIARFVAREHGFNGASELEAFAIDSIVEGINDVRKPFNDARQIKDETERKAKFAAFFKDVWPTWGARFNAILAANNEGKGFFVGNKLSYADIYFFNTVTFAQEFDATFLSAHPLLVGLIERVRAVPGIAAWLAKRPVTAV
jgi:glutathione S-transferase